MTMHVTLRQLRAFVAVLETGSFSEAAASMHLSQAALSGLIRELESRVGVRLLDRTTRSVSPSAVGEAFEPMARRVLASLDEALDSLSNLKELRRGVVRVAAPEPLSCTLMPELIAGFAARHPGVDVRFEDVPIELVLSGLQNGSVDVGFGPPGVIGDDAIAVHELWADPLWVALPRGHAFGDAESVGWKDLRETTVINYMPNFALNVLSHVPARHHPRRIVPVHRVNTALSMLQVTRGAVVCPLMTEPLVRGFSLAFLPLRQPQVSWSVAMFVRRGPSVPPATQAFLGFAQEFTRGRGTGGAPASAKRRRQPAGR
jgi:DNA-binding transcriptional LysR family regulator